MISVLIADDHAMIRDVLRRLLERAGDIEVIATALNGQEAVERAISYRPNVAVMDISMPLLNGIEATKKIFAECPKTGVLMLSGHHSPHYIQRCLQAGALGYVIKDTVVGDLVMAVQSIYLGKRFFSKQIAEVAKHFTQ